MSIFQFENQGTTTLLVYEIQENDELDTMSLGMLTNNHIPGFLPAYFTQMDANKYIKYNVSAKVSVKQLFGGPVNKKRLLGVFTGIVDAMLSAEDYMLDPDSILLDPEYMFANVSTCETDLIALPVMNQQHEHQDLAMFLKNILFTTQFDQTENCDHVAQLINYLNSNPVLALTDFKELLQRISQNTGAQAAPRPAVAPAPQPAVQPKAAPQPGQKPVQQPAARPVAQPQPQRPGAAPVQQPAPRTAPNSAPAMPRPAPAPQAPSGEKPMSWMYLMQHYNKENAAIYKAQQEAKKNGAKPAPAPQRPAAPMPQQRPATGQPQAGFAVPGQNPGFAVPGQAAPAPQRPVSPVPQPGPQAAPAPRPVPQAAPAPRPVPQAAPVSQPAAPVSAPQTPLNFGETTVLGGGAVGETTVLGGAAAPAKNDPHLIRTKNSEKISLNKPVFRIGKERSYVDYFISDNTAISRSHANIVNHNGEFVVVDTNSTNHTYVNGAMIQSGVETKLAHGDKIRLANEDFEFRMR